MILGFCIFTTSKQNIKLSSYLRVAASILHRLTPGSGPRYLYPSQTGQLDDFTPESSMEVKTAIADYIRLLDLEEEWFESSTDTTNTGSKQPIVLSSSTFKCPKTRKTIKSSAVSTNTLKRFPLRIQFPLWKEIIQLQTNKRYIWKAITLQNHEHKRCVELKSRY